MDKRREAVRLLERTGDFLGKFTLRGAPNRRIVVSHGRPGRCESTRRSRIHASGIELGDEQASGISLDVWARAAPGQLPLHILQQEVNRQRHDAQGTGQVAIAEGVLLIHNDQLEQAATRLENAIHDVRQAGVWNAYVSPSLAWLATALRCQGEREGIYGRGSDAKRFAEPCRPPGELDEPLFDSKTTCRMHCASTR